jgi:tRNA G37 N-methylase TrmD
MFYFWSMRYTFSIDESSEKALALLQYLRTLEFVKEETPEFTLSDEHKKILQERRVNYVAGNGKTYSLKEVMDSLD